MDAKMKECFTPHAMMHNLFGVGLGLVLANLFPSLSASLWIGVVVIVVALVVDMMRKK